MIEALRSFRHLQREDKLETDSEANHATQLTPDPRHGSCVRTYRATVPVQLVADVGARQIADDI
jgi:hypothetical protein